MDRPVLLTGSEGHVGEAILRQLSSEYEWRFLDREPPTNERPGEFFVVDITDGAGVSDAVDGVGSIIHLAGDPRPEAPWNSVLRNNIDGTQTILQAAVDADVEKFVFASSNHAVGGYETIDRQPHLYRSYDEFRLDGTELPRPGNLYGVSKAAGEVLCRYYHDMYGISIVCVRIGNLTENHPPKDYERGQAMWLSYRDCAHLFECCLEAEYAFEIVYGISNNDGRYYSLARARDVLGYDPQDNSARYVD